MVSQVMDAEVAGNGAVGKNPVLGPQQSFARDAHRSDWRQDQLEPN